MDVNKENAKKSQTVVPVGGVYCGGPVGGGGGCKQDWG